MKKYKVTNNVKRFANELSTKFAGHHKYSGDTVLSSIRCIVEGRELDEATPLDVSSVLTKNPAVGVYASVSELNKILSIRSAQALTKQLDADLIGCYNPSSFMAGYELAFKHIMEDIDSVTNKLEVMQYIDN